MALIAAAAGTFGDRDAGSKVSRGLNLLRLASGLLPAGKLKNFLLRRLGYSVVPTASIAPVLIWNVARLVVGQAGRIGPLNVIRDVASLELGGHAVIGQWNWISAALPLRQSGAPGSLHVGEHSAVTSRHYLDVSGGVRIGSHTTVAGVRSTFITHGIDWRSSRQVVKGIVIGNYCLVGSNTNISPGVVIADRVIVAMGSTLGGTVAEDSLYLGGRAVRVKGVVGEYFMRKEGFVSPGEGYGGDQG